MGKMVYKIRKKRRFILIVTIALLLAVAISIGSYAVLTNNNNNGTRVVVTMENGSTRTIRVPIEFRQSEYEEFEGLYIVVVDFSRAEKYFRYSECRNRVDRV